MKTNYYNNRDNKGRFTTVRKIYYVITERTYDGKGDWWKTRLSHDKTYESKSSAKRAIGQLTKGYNKKEKGIDYFKNSYVSFYDENNVLKSYTVEPRFYDQKATVVWKKEEKKRLPKQVTIPADVANWWRFGETVFDYLKEKYGSEVVELHWGKIC